METHKLTEKKQAPDRKRLVPQMRLMMPSTTAVTGIDGLIPALCAKARALSLEEGRPVKLAEVQ